MRSALKILITVLVLGVLFAGYLWLQPGGTAPLTHAPGTLDPIVPTSRPAPGGSFVGDAEGVAVNRYDDETGELVSRFRFARSRQVEADRMRVEAPVAEFYHERDIIRVTGAHGIIVRPPVPQGGDRQALEGNDALAGMPSRGELSDVRIEWFDSPDAANGGDPMLTLTMNNVSFDNETFRIATEGYTAEDGTFVTGDQVPVTVVGDEMSFRGRGLILRWNDRDRRLELLEILHGESMVLSDPAVLSRLREGGDAASAEPGPQPATQPTPQDLSPRQSAAAAPAATSPTTAPATRPVRVQPTYHARFEQAVRVRRARADVARGDSLIVNFRMPQDSGRRERRSTSTTAQPTTRRARRDRSSASTQPGEPDVPIADESIEVRWTGRMRITPLDAPLDQPLPPGETAVRLIGSPLELSNAGWSIDAATLAYRTDQEIARVGGSDERPDVTLRNDEGAVITAREIEHHPAGHVSSMRGPGSAVVPLDPDAGADDRLSAQWQDVAAFRFAQDESVSDAMVIEQADLSGAVRVAHPKFGLSSDDLSLLFDPPTTQPTTAPAGPTGPSDVPPLRRAIARGHARVTMPSEDGQAPQSLAGDSVDIEADTTEAGEPYPRRVTVIGNAVASGADGELRANHLFTSLVPAPPPGNVDGIDDHDEAAGEGFVIESLRAQDDVRFRSADGTSADADQITLERGADGPVLQLVGQPTATLSNGRDTIGGPMIRYQVERQLADVLGAGSLHAIREQTGDAPRPVDVTWSGRVHVSGAANLIEVYDDVTMTTTEQDQTRTTARAERVQIALRDAAPADGSSDAGDGLATQPSKSDGLGLLGSGDADLLKGKEPSVVTFQDDVTVSSELLADDGAVIRRGFLKAPRLIYDIPADYLDIPSAGEMLLEDHEQTEAKDPQGTTAFAWTDSLTYSGERSLITMLGNVKINHVPEGEEADKSFTILTHRVRAELAPDEAEDQGAGVATTQEAVATDAQDAPTTRPTLDDLSLRRVIADGWVRVWADEMEVHAEEATYDPQSRWLVLSGTPQRPVYIFNTTGDMTGTVREMRWNSQTGELKVEGVQGNVR